MFVRKFADWIQFANGTKCSRMGSVRGWDGTYTFMNPASLLHKWFPEQYYPPTQKSMPNALPAGLPPLHHTV